MTVAVTQLIECKESDLYKKKKKKKEQFSALSDCMILIFPNWYAGMVYKSALSTTVIAQY